MTDKTKKITIEEWRQLGYFYDRDDKAKQWKIVGSPFGIKSFNLQLQKYYSNIKNNVKSEHDHFGPYSYLKIMTWDSSGINENSIYGTIDDLKRLSSLIEKETVDSNINKKIEISKEYSDDTDYAILLDIREYGFDPAKEDLQLWD